MPDPEQTGDPAPHPSAHPPVRARPLPALRPAGPALDSERLSALDTVRGFALLGIFLVNIFSFSQTFGEFALPPEVDWKGDPLNAAADYFSHLFCMGKFYPLFSMLFGIGLILQTSRADRSGESVAPMYLRRQGVLLLIGLVHALALWYGDILFVYAICGTIAFFARRLQARTLAFIGGGVLTLALFLGAAAAAWQGLSATPSEPAPFEPDASRLAIAQLFEMFGDGQQMSPMDPRWIALERQAYSQGPYLDSLAFRAFTWAMYIGFCLMNFGWHVLSMFFFGMALAKWRIFAPENRRTHLIFVGAGLLAGLPLSALAMAAMSGGGAGAMAGATALSMVSGPLMSLGYLAAVTLIVNSGIAGVAARAISNVGRMGLTNYLTQTVVSTTIFYHWGFAMFGKVSAAQCVGIVFAVYAVQIVVSNLWMSRFRFGPMEWVWRSLTYLKAQPMAKHAGAGE